MLVFFGGEPRFFREIRISNSKNYFSTAFRMEMVVVMLLSCEQQMPPSRGHQDFGLPATKNQDVVNPNHYKSIFSVPRPLEANILSLGHFKQIYLQAAQNQYFPFPDH